METPRTWMRIVGALALSAGVMACDDTDNGGDASCPEGRVRSGDSCIPVGGSGGGAGGAGGAVGGAGGAVGGAGGAVGGAGGGPVGMLPVALDDHFSPSGFMGDGESGGITAGTTCPMRTDGAVGECHNFVYTPGMNGWGGVFWQSPQGNWGDDPGYLLPQGATRLQFTAWGAAGGERVSFQSGYGAADGYSVSTEFIELTNTPTTYTLDIAGVPYTDIAGGLAWFTEAADGPVEFYIDDLQFLADPADEVDLCTVTCATSRAVENCAGVPGYLQCKEACGNRIGGECATEVEAYLTCVAENGWTCTDDALASTGDCSAALDTLVACEGEPPAQGFPFFIEEQFVMSGFMGGGEVEAEPCAMDATEGGCLRITWTPNGNPWVGFFFQHPENNWGDLPGLMVEPGATHVRYRVWGETGTERANFAAGINEVDTFNVETGYDLLSDTPEDRHMLIPEGVVEIKGGFAWFLENPGEAETVTFYLDDVQWRNDDPPGGPVDPPENVDVTFQVDMNCAEHEFTEVFVTGPFCEWCAEGFPLVDDNNDGIYEGTYQFPSGPLEYKYMVDGFANQENLIDDVQAGNGACAPVTDGANFANRQVNLVENVTLTETYGQCQACGDEPPPPPEEVDVTFRVDMNCAEHEFTEVFVTGPFCEWCGEGFPLTDPDGDGTYEGTYRFPSGPLEYKYMVDGFVNQENLLDDVQAGNGACAPVTDGANFANRQVNLVGNITLDETYGQCSDCGDDPPPPPEEADVTFRVDMSCAEHAFNEVFITGPFCNWCGDGFQLNDPDGDGTYEGTFRFPTGALEYKYMVDGFANQENLLDDVQAGNGDCAPITDGANFANRQVNIAGNLTLDETYGRCDGCGDEPPPPPPGDAMFEQRFDDAASANGWMLVADAVDNGEVMWADGAGNPGGALRVSGTNPDENGRAFIFQYEAVGLDFDSAEVNVSFDLRLGAPLVASAVHAQTILPGVGATNHFDLQNNGLNDAGWTNYSFDYEGVALGNGNFIIHFNFAAGAVADAGGVLFIDNIVVTSGGGGIDPPPPGEGSVEFSVNMNCAEHDFTTVFVTGPFCEWCGDGFPLSDEDGDGIWTGTYPFANGDLEYKYMVDGFANQEDLIGDGDCAPITDGANFANRQITVDGVTAANDVYGQCEACNDGPPPPPEGGDVTFRVDMGCAEHAFNEVFVTGPFCNWCAEGFPLTDPDGDGTYEGTYAFPAGALEYKYMVDGFVNQENLIDDVQAGDGACAPVTDGAGFANRQIMVNGDVTLDEVYGQCSACEPPPPRGVFETVTFDDPEVVYAAVGFGGADDSQLVPDPTDAANTVVQVVKTEVAELWAGTTAVSGPNEDVGVIPIDAENTRMTVRVWSPVANIPVRLKIEDARNNQISVETEATVTEAMVWETLTFDFDNQAPDTAALNPDATYDKVSIFFDFGTSGPDVGEARTYYFDDITFVGGGGVVPPQNVNATFRVDMSCAEHAFNEVFVTGPFCNWCAEGFPLTDPDGDGTYEGTYEFPEGPLEYKYMVDGFANQENLVDDVQAGDGACAPVTDGAGFANRQANIVDGIVLDETYGRCSACEDDGPQEPVDGEMLRLEFDDATSVDTWIRVADAENFGIVGWADGQGNPGGALQVSATNPDESGRAFIFQYNAADVNFSASDVTVSFDLRLAAPLVASAVHMQTILPGAGAVNEFDLQANGLNEGGWTSYSFDYQGVTQGNGNFSIHFNFAAGAVADAGGVLLIDNVVVAPTGGAEPPPADPEVTFSVDMSCSGEDFTTVYVTGPFCNWCADGYPLSDDDGDGIWSGTYPFENGALEYKYMVDGFASQEDLIGDGDCAPITDGANFANRQITVNGATTADDVYGQCTACENEPPPAADADWEQRFDDAASVNGWTPVADAVDNGELMWADGAGNPGGALRISGTNPNNSGRAFIFQYEAVGVDFSSDAVRVSFDLRLAAPLVASAVHAQTVVPGVGATNHFDLQAQGLNENDWTSFSFDYENVTTGNGNFIIHFNFAAGAVDASGGAMLIDNIVITPTGNPAPPADSPVTFSVDMNCSGENFNTVFVTGPFCNWCADGYPLADADGDGIWTGTYPFADGDLEYKYMVDGFVSQEDLIGDGDCAPITDGATFANRQITVNGATMADDVYGQCAACDNAQGPGADELLRLEFDDAAAVNEWSPVADALIDGVILWADGSGNPGGAMQISASNTEEVGRAYIFQYDAADMDFTSSNITVSFDVRLGAPLQSSAIHAQTNLPGVGVTNYFDLQAQGLNENTWTRFSYDYQNVDVAGTNFSIHFNFAAGALFDAGGVLLVDNVVVAPTAGADGGDGGNDGTYDVTFEVDMNCEGPDNFNTVYITGPFCNWCADGYPLSDADGDGVWTATYAFDAGTTLEYKYMVDGWAAQENLVDDVQAGDGACAPVTDGAGFANRQFVVDADTTRTEIYSRCSACAAADGALGAVLGAEDGWSLAWSDEFDAAAGAPVDATKWTHDVGGHGWGNAQLEHNTDRTDNVAHDGNGNLVITAREEAYQGNAYTSARIKTEGLFAQAYGRFEARIQLPRGQGMWPAFWMLGDNFADVGWPACGEIDIMEFRGQNPFTSTAAIHGPGYSGGESLYGARLAEVDLTEGFHVYAVEWDATSISWYVDGALFMTRTVDDLPNGAAWVYDHPFFLILNVAVGGTYVGSPDGTTQFPQQMLIDYVRAYQRLD
ncbi:MAG: family 16 glycosylhydrolase [Bradymonadia bacterium]